MALINRQPFASLPRIVFISVMLVIGVHSARSQAQPKSTSSPFPDATSNGREDKEKDDDRYGSPEAEMRAKLMIKEEKKRYDEHVERAREVFQLTNQISKNYESHQSFSPDDQKKLERIEKLTKRIRNDAGGSESETNVDVKDIPPATLDLVKRAAEWADQLREMVEKTPRQVVSAAVIDQANKLLGLVQHIRVTTK